MTAKRRMRVLPVALPFWLRVVLLASVVCVLAGAGLVAYRFYVKPVTLSLAVGSFDGEAGQIASIIASRLTATGAPVRLKIVQSSNVLDSAQMLAAGKVDLAVVRADVGDLSQAMSVAVVTKGVLMLVAAPGSAITSVEKLRGHTVGVIGGEANRKIVEALQKEYDLAGKVVFKDMTPADGRRALLSKEVGALLFVVPLNERYLSLVRALFQGGRSASLIPIESAGAIADVAGAYESFDIPQGTIRGAPPIPDADLTTLRVGFFLVANKKLDADLIASLTQSLMNSRRELVAEQPVLAGLAAPDTDPDAYIPVHPGAAAFYNGTQQSFMDKYSNWIYLTPMVLGALASIAAAAWRFLGVQQPEPAETALKELFVLPRRIRDAASEAELTDIEKQADEVLASQFANAIGGGQDALDLSMLIAIAHRLDNAIHHRRQAFAAGSQFRDG